MSATTGDDDDLAFHGPTELVFFASSLRLRRTEASDLEPDASATPHRRLAQALIGDDRRPSLREHVKAPFSAVARVERARALLHDLESYEIHSDHELYRRCWETAIAEWRWVATSSRARLVLVAHAQRLGIDAAIAGEVAVLIETELLNGLVLRRLHLQIDQKVPGSEVDALFRSLTITPRFPLALVPLFAHALPLLSRYPGAPAVLVHESLTALLDRQDLSSDVADLLVDRYAEMLDSWLLHAAPALLSYPVSFEKLILRIGLVERRCATLALLDVHASVLCSWADAETRAKAGAARVARLIAEASTCNPFDATVRARLADGPKKIHKPTRRAIEADELGIADALRYVYTGERMVALRRAATRRELAARVVAASGSDRASRLAAIHESFEGLSVRLAAGDELAQALPHELLDQQPELRALAWEGLAGYFRLSPELGNEAVARAMPPRRFPAARVSEAIRRAFCRDAKPNVKNLRSTQRLTWAFSGTDWLFKMAAMIGMALALHASPAAWQHHAMARLDSQYMAVVASMEDANDATTVATASAFLVMLDDPKDPRRGQVVGWRDEALVREVFRLSEAGDVAAAKALLEQTAVEPTDRQ